MAHSLPSSPSGYPIMVGSAFALLLTIGYCAAVGAAEAHDFRIGLATGWALAAVAPLALAADALRRHRLPTLSRRMLAWMTIALAALTLSLLLTCANALWHFGATNIDPTAWLLRRAPLYGTALLLVELLLELTRKPSKETIAPAHGKPPVAASLVSATDVVLPDGQVIANISEVERVTAAANYAQFESANGAFLARVTLNELAQLLAPHGFVRVHRSILVNLRFVQRVARRGRKLNIHLRDGTIIVAGETYRRSLAPTAQAPSH